MDSSITAAGRALRAGDPLGALKHVALREDPAALALRGIAMAQLGDLGRARELLKKAARGFGPRETLARARCLTASAEVALATRDLGAWSPQALSDAQRTFAAHGDRENAAHARLLQIRRLLLLGRIDEADGECATFQLGAGPARLAAVAALVTFEIALLVQTKEVAACWAAHDDGEACIANPGSMTVSCGHIGRGGFTSYTSAAANPVGESVFDVSMRKGLVGIMGTRAGAAVLLVYARSEHDSDFLTLVNQFPAGAATASGALLLPALSR